ncbi:MAG: hypothetical protein AAF716_11015 [Cyanobacteria bacterium P01_D01_bin.1]
MIHTLNENNEGDFFHIPRNTDSRLIQNIELGNYCCLIGPPQSGKTRLVNIGRKEFERRSNCRCASISLRDLTTEFDPFRWYLQLVSTIGSQLGIRTQAYFTTSKRASYTRAPLTAGDILYDFFDELLLPQVPLSQIIVFIEDIESIDTFISNYPERDLGGFKQSFFKVIRRFYTEANSEKLSERGLANHMSRIQLVLSGAISGKELQDLTTTQGSGNLRTSFVKLLEIERFSLNSIEEDEVLLRSIKEKADIGTRDLREVFSITNGHPALTIKSISILSENSHRKLEDILPIIYDEYRKYVLSCNAYSKRTGSAHPLLGGALSNASILNERRPNTPAYSKSSSISSGESINSGTQSQSHSNYPRRSKGTTIEGAPATTRNGINKKRNNRIWFFTVVVAFAFITVALAIIPSLIATVFWLFISEGPIPRFLWPTLISLIIADIVLAIICVYLNNIISNDASLEKTQQSLGNLKGKSGRFIGRIGGFFAAAFSRRFRSFWLVFLFLTALTGVVAIPGITNSFGPALIHPGPAKGSLAREAKRLLHDFQRGSSDRSQVSLLQEALINASKADKLRRRVDGIIYRKGEEHSASLLALQYIYDRTSESQNFKASDTETIGIFDISEGNAYEGNDIAAVVGSNSGEVVILKRDGTLIPSFDADQGKITDIKVTNDGRFVITAGVGSVKIWNTEATDIEGSGEKIDWVESGEQRPTISAIQLLEDEGLLVGLSNEGNLKAWSIDLTSPQTLGGVRPVFGQDGISIQVHNDSQFIPGGRMRSSEECVAVSARVRNNASDKLKTLSIDAIADGTVIKEQKGIFSLSESFPEEFYPAAVDISRDSRFLVVAGGLGDPSDGDPIEKIEIIPLSTQEESGFCKPLSQPLQNVVWPELNNMSSIVDVRLSRNGRRLFVMYGDGSFLVYALFRESEGNQKPNFLDDLAPHILFEGRPRLNVENYSSRIVPSADSDFQFLTSIGADELKVWDISFIKEDDYLYEYEALSDEVTGLVAEQSGIRNTERRGITPRIEELSIENFIPARGELSSNYHIALQLSNRKLIILNSQFSAPVVPEAYKNRDAKRMASGMSSDTFYFATVSEDANNKVNVEIYSSRLSALHETKGDYNVATIPSSTNTVTSIAFSPRKRYMAFSNSKNIRLVRNFTSFDNSRNPEVIDLSSRIDKIESLSFSYIEDNLAFLSNKNLVVCNVAEPYGAFCIDEEGRQQTPSPVSGTAYKDVKFYPLDDNGDFSFRSRNYLFAMTADGRKIDIWRIDNDQKVKKINSITIEKLKEEWNMLDSIADEWTSWSFDEKGSRLTMGAKDQVMVFSLEEGVDNRTNLEKRLIALYRSKSDDLWGNIQEISFGQRDASGPGYIFAMGEGDSVPGNQRFIKVYSGGDFSKLKNWSCSWLKKHHTHSQSSLNSEMSKLSSEAANICGHAIPDDDF